MLKEIEEIQASRLKEIGSNTCLVVIGEGTVSAFTPQHEKNMEDFIICFDGVDKDEIQDRFHSNITALINSIVSQVESVIDIKKVSSSLVFFREDGRPVYSYTFSGGAADCYFSRALTDDNLQAIRELYQLLSADKTLLRVQHLVRSSLETDGDSLRAFLAAWSAFEILVNKLFVAYENNFFMGLLEDGHPEVQKKFVGQIRDVMKRAYRLADKFAVISFQLSPMTADEDAGAVLQVKKVRDLLTHGEPVEESTLPVNVIRGLVNKYLRLHVEKTPC